MPRGKTSSWFIKNANARRCGATCFLFYVIDSLGHSCHSLSFPTNWFQDISRNESELANLDVQIQMQLESVQAKEVALKNLQGQIEQVSYLQFNEVSKERFMIFYSFKISHGFLFYNCLFRQRQWSFLTSVLRSVWTTSECLSRSSWNIRRSMTGSGMNNMRLVGIYFSHFYCRFFLC